MRLEHLLSGASSSKDGLSYREKRDWCLLLEYVLSSCLHVIKIEENRRSWETIASSRQRRERGDCQEERRDLPSPAEVERESYSSVG